MLPPLGHAEDAIAQKIPLRRRERRLIHQVHSKHDIVDRDGQDGGNGGERFRSVQQWRQHGARQCRDLTARPAFLVKLPLGSS